MRVIAAIEKNMSRLKRDYYRKKVGRVRAELERVMASADDESFLQMVWAVDALQSGHSGLAARVLRFPSAAVTDDFSSPYSVHPWELDTLANFVIQTPKTAVGPRVNCAEFATVTWFVNLLRKLENMEAGSYLEPGAIWNEMHRIGHRQFNWQRGYVNIPDFYRSIYLYGQGRCAEFFERQYGISIGVFTKAAFAIFATLTNAAWSSRGINLRELNLTPEIVELTLAPMTVSIREAAVTLGTIIEDAGAVGLPTAFRPSLLRRRPIISFGSHDERIRSPLPSLIMHRVPGKFIRSN